MKKAAQKLLHMLMDPICGMEVASKKGAAKFEYKGRTYYFCSTKCRDEFLVALEDYVE